MILIIRFDIFAKWLESGDWLCFRCRINISLQIMRKYGYIHPDITQHRLPKGLCKVKKIQNKFGLSSPHPPAIQTFFWNPITDMDRTLKA